MCRYEQGEIGRCRPNASGTSVAKEDVAVPQCFDDIVKLPIGPGRSKTDETQAAAGPLLQRLDRCSFDWLPIGVR